MNCLCCGKPIIASASASEMETQWHRTCVRKFFGTRVLPEMDITEKTLELIAAESTNKGFTVPGVQKKMSLHLTTDGVRPRLTLVNYPMGYILKPQADQYQALPEAEFLVMQMASLTGIPTVPYALLRTADGFAYITKRIDRCLSEQKIGTLQMAMEDFCQLDLRLTEDKYRGSYERCAKIIAKYSQSMGLDLSELFLRVVFSFVVGNSDMHLKNFSLIETAAGNGVYRLSAAYDMLPVNIIVPEDPEQLALTVNGKKRNLHRNDFLKFAESIALPRPAAERMLNMVISMLPRYQMMCENSYLPNDMKELFSVLLSARTDSLRQAVVNA